MNTLTTITMIHREKINEINQKKIFYTTEKVIKRHQPQINKLPNLKI